jgi:aspartate aminotransferase
MGPDFIIDKMKSILGHIGAWSPKAEQLAAAEYLKNDAAVDAFLNRFRGELLQRLQGIYQGFEQLRSEGFPVRCIEPAGAIYLTAQFSLKGRQTPEGKVLQTTDDLTAYILGAAKLAIVPFSAFGASRESDWYRLSVGTCKLEDLPTLFSQLRAALGALK